MRKAMKLLLFGSLMLVLAVPAVASVEPGQTAPDFTLTDTDGNEHTLSTYLQAGFRVVLEWFNPDCPFIKKHHALAKTMNETYAAVPDSDVVWLAINSGAAGKQGHGLERNRKARVEYDMPFPVLLDEDGSVGRTFGAKTTPHMFVIDSDGTVAYAGAIDDNRHPQQLGETNYVAAALAALHGGTALADSLTRPYGCSVKYGE